MSNIFPKKICTKVKADTLARASAGKRYKLVSCSLEGNTKTRLYEMGLVDGTEVSVLKKAPMGDPLEISARGYSLCIRAKEAKHFSVEELRP